MRGRRGLWLGAAVIAIGCIGAIVAMRLDVVRLLENPSALGGAIVLGLHALGGVLVATLALVANKRRPRR
jgi:hypothetical protein